MDREQVKSSNIKSVGYDPEQKILEIEFKSGSVYQYEEVPEDVFQEMLVAESVGKYFNTQVKGIYSEKRI
jgi:hypothetical protein